MNIIAFAGSNAEQSINKKLVEYAASYFQTHEIEFLDLNDYEMPLYKPEREAAGLPEQAKIFAAKIDNADLLLISLAEYNSSYTSAFKNLFDWVSRVQNRSHFGDKPVFLMSAAPGPGGGKNVTEAFLKRAPFSGAHVLENFILPKFKDNFKDGEGIINPELKKEFEDKVSAVKEKLEM